MFDVILGIIAVVAYVKLVSLYALPWPHETVSEFERERLEKAGGSQARELNRFHRLLPQLRSLFRISAIFYEVAIVLIFIHFFGVTIGGMAVIVVLLLLGPISRLGFVSSQVQRLYAKQQQRVERVVTHPRVEPVLHWLRGVRDDERKRATSVHSREEFMHELGRIKHILSHREIQQIKKSLGFHEAEVRDRMTPIDEVPLVKEDEILGPKLLDELHRTGWEFFPVIPKNENVVIGTLSAQEIMHTRRQGKITAGELMGVAVMFKDSDSLEVALRRLLREKQFLGIVKNNSEEYIGVITLDDIIAALVTVSS